MKNLLMATSILFVMGAETQAVELHNTTHENVDFRIVGEGSQPTIRVQVKPGETAPLTSLVEELNTIKAAAARSGKMKAVFIGATGETLGTLQCKPVIWITAETDVEELNLHTHVTALPVTHGNTVDMGCLIENTK